MASNRVLSCMGSGSCESEIEDPTCLTRRALQRTRIAHVHYHADTNVVLDELDQVNAGTLSNIQRTGNSRRAFDMHCQRVEMALACQLEKIVRRETCAAQQQFFDLRGENVDTTDNEHVIASAGDPGH